MAGSMRLFILISLGNLLTIGGVPTSIIDHDDDERSIDQIIFDAQSMKEASPIDLNVRDGPENGTVLVEMDMVFDKDDWEEFKRETKLSKRKAVISERRRWTDKTVPYQFDNTFTDRHKTNVMSAFDDYHRYTCIQFKPRTNEAKYIQLAHGSGCSSYVGMQSWGGRGQKVSLANGCRYKRTIVHELGHAIGFHHEQCRPDRDTYMKIHLENVSPGHEHNFRKYTTSSVQSYGVAYDYGSVMHYGGYFFSKNRKLTMETIDPAWQKKIGTAPTLSFKDIQLANIIYKCSEHCGQKKCPKGAFVDKNCKCMCKGPSTLDPVQECGCKKKK